MVTSSIRAAQTVSQPDITAALGTLPTEHGLLLYFARHLMCAVEIPLSFLTVIWGGQPVVLILGASVFPDCLLPTRFLVPQDGH